MTNYAPKKLEATPPTSSKFSFTIGNAIDSPIFLSVYTEISNKYT